MTLRLTSAQRAANPNFGPVDKLAQDIGSLSARRRQRGMLTDLLDPLTDPMATSADYATAARGLIPIDQQSALAVAAQGRDLAIKEAETQQFEQRKAALMANATRLGFPDIATSVGSISDSDELAEVGKELRKRVLDNTPTQTPAQRRFIAKSVGISEQTFNDLKLDKGPDKNFNEFVSGQGGELEPFLRTAADGTSKIVHVRINNGLAWDNKAQTWKTAEEMGLQRPPPQVRVVENINKSLGPQLVEEGVKLFAQSAEDAQKAAESLNSVNRSLPLIDNMFTGMGAETKLNIARFGRFFGIDMVDPESIADTEVYLADSGRRVAQYITNLGAGTGLSDADRDYAKSVVAGDISIDAEAMKQILLIAKQANEGLIKEYYDRRAAIRSELEKTNQESALVFYPSPVLDKPLGSGSGQATSAGDDSDNPTANLRWDDNLQDFVLIQ